jgi:hypothetical protein
MARKVKPSRGTIFDDNEVGKISTNDDFVRGLPANIRFGF